MKNVINWWKAWWKHHQEVCKQVKRREDEMWNRRGSFQPSSKSSTDSDSRFWPFGDGGGMA